MKKNWIFVDMFNFEGKVVIIIGVNSGLGFVFVKVLV